MNNFKSTFLQILKNNDIERLNIFIEKHDIRNNEYDLLIFAIENDASFYFIKLILNKYDSVNYIFEEPRFRNNENFRNPLYSAISKNNFKLADYLKKKKT